MSGGGGNLRRIRKRTYGMTLARLAEIVGISESQLSRFETGQRRPRVDEIHRIAAALKVTVGDIFPDFADIEASENAAKDAAEPPPQVNFAPVRGYTQAGVWTEFEEFEDDGFAREEVPSVPGRWSSLPQFAFRVRGNSMDADRIFDGDYVICVPYFDARVDLRDGDRVVIERRRNSAVERTVKQIQLDGNQVWLCPRSSDPRFQPVVLDMDRNFREADDTEIKIIGLVIGRWAPF